MASKLPTVEATDGIVRQEDIKSDIEELGTDFSYTHKIAWKNVIIYVLTHIVGIYSIYTTFTFKTHILTFFYGWILGILGNFGVSMAAHRYFSHKTFKAKPILRRILFILFIMTNQYTLWEWVRDHRQHHKYCDTDADPHNANRGFFYSHVGWLLTRRHPKVHQYRKTIDMSDMEADSWAMWQRKHPHIIYSFTAFLPCIIPVVFWNEDPLHSFLTVYLAKTIILANITFCINSVTHIYGTRPHEKNFLATQNQFVDKISFGDGWHNFHHVFPWDYRGAEFGMNFSLSTIAIDYCAKIGWAYDLKTVSEESIENRVKKSGDNSHVKYGDATKYEGVETWMNLWKSPNNPTYSSKRKPNPVKIKRQYVLYESDNQDET